MFLSVFDRLPPEMCRRRVGNHTRVCHRNRLCVEVTETVSDGRDDSQHDRTDASYDAGPEESRTLTRCPAPVSEGLLPEVGRAAGHFDFCEGVNRVPTAIEGRVQVVAHLWWCN